MQSLCLIEIPAVDVRVLDVKRENSVFINLRQNYLSFLKVCVLLDKFFLAVTGKADSEFDIIARPFAAKDEAAAILFVSDVRPWRETSVRHWSVIFGLRRPGGL